MANDKQKNQDPKERRDERNPSQESFPGNPNTQNQESPRQQQSDSGAKRKPSHLHEDRSVTDRTLRKSVIDRDDEDDGEIDALK